MIRLSGGARWRWGHPESTAKCERRVTDWRHLQRARVTPLVDNIRGRVERLERRAGAGLGMALEAEDLGSLGDIMGI